MADPLPFPTYRDPPPFSVTAQGHAFIFHHSGADRLEALLGLIREAQTELKLCFYIFAEDQTGQTVRDALAEAAARGVAVTLIVDGFGAAGTEAFLAPLQQAGGRVFYFSADWSRSYLIRNHQKMVIADGARALICGYNIADAYFAPPAENGWNDLGLIIAGPVVEPLLRWFLGLEAWVTDAKAHWRVIRRRVREWDPGTGPVRLLVGGPTRALNSWARSLKRDLERSGRLDMMMAYFTPSPGLLRRIRRIARKGRTRLLMPAHSDNGATIGASRLLYGTLLEQGAAIWEFSPCKLHTKLIVLDDAVYVGSANFDMRSMFLNLELMLRIEDAALADRMREHIGRTLAHSERITPALHRQRATAWNRLRWTLSWFLVAVLDYTVARRLNLGL